MAILLSYRWVTNEKKKRPLFTGVMKYHSSNKYSAIRLRSKVSCVIIFISHHYYQAKNVSL